MVLSWIEDVTSEYFRKTGHLIFNNISYFAVSPKKKVPSWQEFDVLVIKEKKAKIISCKRGLTPDDYDKQAEFLNYHRKNLLNNEDLSKYRCLFSGSPELILVIEYPRPKHVQRIEAKEIKVLPFDKLLKDFIKVLYEELKKNNWKEGKEPNYSTRLIKGLLKKGIIKIN